jgi:hypothetical protein
LIDYSFPRYLLAKQTVDDRALNRYVLEALQAHLAPPPLRVIEVGAGMGNMLARLVSRGMLKKAEYIHEDALAENLNFAAEWIPKWAETAGLRAEHVAENALHLFDRDRDLRIRLEPSDFQAFVSSMPEPADLLIAHAFLDLLPMPRSLAGLLSLTHDLAWLTINFDGLTVFEPTLDPDLDAQIITLYHETMDQRPTGGDSRAGRHLLGYLRDAGATVLAAGSSDWVVYAQHGRYVADEAYFLRFILHFFEESLTDHPDLDAAGFKGWLATRRSQIEKGELVYVAHQLDFLAQVRQGSAT